MLHSKSTWLITMLLALSLTSSLASAQIPSSQPTPLLERKSLKKGQIAPFDGQLLSHAYVATLLSSHKADLEKLKLEIEFLKKKNTADVKTAGDVCQTKLDAEKKLVKLCESTSSAKQFVYEAAVTRTSKECERKWYESPYFNFALGAVVFGTVSGGVSYAASRK